MATDRRKKKYHPKPKRYPSLVAKVMPPVSQESLTNIALAARIPLDAMKRGEVTKDHARCVVSALQHMYVMAAAFEEKGRFQALALVAKAGVAGALHRKLRDGVTPEPELYEPADACLGYLEEMQAQLDRKTAIDAVRVAHDHSETMMKIPDGWAFLALPEGECRDFDKYDKRGLCFINGVIRTGFLRWNEEMNRDEWVDVLDGVQVPITRPTVIVIIKEETK